MLVSGRNNVKEILRNFSEINGVRMAYCQDNFNENDIDVIGTYRSGDKVCLQIFFVY